MKYVALKIDIVQIILSTMVINRIKHIYFDNYSFQIKTKRKLKMNQNLNEPNDYYEHTIFPFNFSNSALCHLREITYPGKQFFSFVLSQYYLFEYSMIWKLL